MTQHYVAYDTTGKIIKTVDKDWLEIALKDFELEGKLANLTWELRWSPWERDVIQVRIAPRLDIGGEFVGDNWRTYLYEFHLVEK